jgi:MFS family permease
LIFIDLIAIISFTLIGLASENFHFLQLLIARIIIAFNIGMSTTPAVMYTAEISPPEIRGRLSMLSSPFFTAFGMLVIYFLGAVVTVSDFLQLDKKN